MASDRALVNVFKKFPSVQAHLKGSWSLIFSIFLRLLPKLKQTDSSLENQTGLQVALHKTSQ